MLAALAGGQASAYLDEAGMPDVITANRLTDGVVVFQTIDGSWTEDFNRAAVLPDPEATAGALKRAKEDEANNIVVDAYAIVVEERNGHLAPKALREAIAKVPSDMTMTASTMTGTSCDSASTMRPKRVSCTKR